MIDGITIKYLIANFEEWKQYLNTQFTLTIFEDTGELSAKKREETTVITHRAKWQTFDLIVKEVLNTTTGKTIFHLTIKGSLHKNHFAGKNYLPFTWQQLQQQINQLCKTLNLNPSQAQIATLEVGVNIVPIFEVTPFLMQNIISYKGNSFNRYKKDNTGFCLGIYCTFTQYEIKIYDKGKQNELPQNLMRFEKRFLRMEELNKYGIKFLSDLQQRPKVENLLTMVLEAWQNVLIYDIEPGQTSILKSKLKVAEIGLITTGQNPKYWEALKSKNVRQFNYQRDKFKKLVAKYGKNWQQLVNELIKMEWQELFKNCTNLQSGEIVTTPKNCTILKTGENANLSEFTIKIKGQIVQKRFCQSCGNDITHQRKGSKNCSPKFVGEAAAHQCRNNSSNPRNNRKNKIKKIIGRGILFSIVPFIAKGRQKKYYGIARHGGIIKPTPGSPPTANNPTQATATTSNGLLFEIIPPTAPQQVNSI